MSHHLKSVHASVRRGGGLSRDEAVEQLFSSRLRGLAGRSKVCAAVAVAAKHPLFDSSLVQEWAVVVSTVFRRCSRSNVDLGSLHC